MAECVGDEAKTHRRHSQRGNGNGGRDGAKGAQINSQPAQATQTRRGRRDSLKDLREKMQQSFGDGRVLPRGAQGAPGQPGASSLPNPCVCGPSGDAAAVDQAMALHLRRTYPFRFTAMGHDAAAVLALYVSLAYLGIRVMRMRPILTEGVREAMLVYNVYQIIFHAYVAFSLPSQASKAGMTWYGNNLEEVPQRFDLVLLIWKLYYNQYIDLIDTAFIVFRKKTSQMTFLHLYKRVLLILCWFLVLKCGCATGDAYMGAFLLCFAQMLTYAYYTLGLLGVKSHVGWKPHITRLYMLTFAALMLHAVYSLIGETQPAGMCVIEFCVMGNLLVLFTDFHHREVLDRTASEEADKKSEERRRVVFSFDSSGWFYVYHFGVARFLKTNILDRLDKEQSGFSGASGGALVGACLCADIDIGKLVSHVIGCQSICEFNPWQMLPCAEQAMDVFRKPGMEKTLTGRLSVLVTRTLLRPPFLMGEAVNTYETLDDCFEMLRASCHVPLLGGVLPFRTRRGYYYDGFFWPSFFVPWRHLQSGDKVIKTSAIGTLGSQIKPSIPFPIWWMILPPKPEVLRGMFQLGYSDAAKFFRTNPNVLDEFFAASSQKKPIPNFLSSPRTTPEISLGSIRALEDAAYRAWLLFIAYVAGIWLVGLTGYALYVD
eukprot:CAMPEP_0114518732 /NCGR_PEP_ID=MMETSP0109-20121206/18602_1 /TAXON_ID=29199 /ORGANISM="Chlorarachnion reptans, Strain CCCM449" /LENGTH=656 /DNA_ID=CAMNT_0001699375 /DNA_START=77 /DNA_END=2048 /DNA_ORIENTATION=-